jgi:ATP-dependent DNA ligase
LLGPKPGFPWLRLGGEVIISDEDGVSDFSALESALAKGGSNELVFYAFDLLHIDGFDIRKCSFRGRKAVLIELMNDPNQRPERQIFAAIRPGVN